MLFTFLVLSTIFYSLSLNNTEIHIGVSIWGWMGKTSTAPGAYFQMTRLSIRNTMLCVLSYVWLFVTPWTVVPQVPLSRDFSGKNTGVGCHFLLQGWNPHFMPWHAESLPLYHQGSPLPFIICLIFYGEMCLYSSSCLAPISTQYLLP